ncbi:MAG TPA: hypothetical protein VMB71_05530 [Acetobacteraceae bacterium]|nr:hypothetical protein [Acetobacteraceae bacterium]
MRTALAALLTLLAAPAAAAPGDLDPSFGTGGFARIPINGFATLATKALVQPDGNILIEAQAAIANAPDVAEIIRLLPNGAIDPSFGTNGVATFTVAGNYVDPADMQLQPDGRILLSGTVILAGQEHPPFHGVVARFTSSGSPDGSFGTGGEIFLTPLGGNAEDAATVTLVQPDGKILVADESFASAQEVLRFESDGSVDKRFGRNGIGATDLGQTTAAMGLQDDGKIVVIGQVAARLTAGGKIDFNKKPGTTIASTSVQALDGGPPLALQTNDQYILGTTTGPLQNDIELQRFSFRNARETSFRGPAIDFGHPTTKQNVSQDYAMIIQPDGGIVVTGRYLTAPHQAFGLARVLPNGALDKSFGKHGRLTTQCAGRECRASALALQPDAKIIAAGTAATATYQDSVLAVARYLGN